MLAANVLGLASLPLNLFSAIVPQMEHIFLSYFLTLLFLCVYMVLIC